jgi:hypothetical protein
LDSATSLYPIRSVICVVLLIIRQTTRRPTLCPELPSSPHAEMSEFFVHRVRNRLINQSLTAVDFDVV